LKTCAAFSNLCRPAKQRKDETACCGKRLPTTFSTTKDKVLTNFLPSCFATPEIELSPEQSESYRLAEDEGVVRLREMKAELTIQRFRARAATKANLQLRSNDRHEHQASGSKPIWKSARHGRKASCSANGSDHRSLVRG
jgi:hypothetical protein